MEEDPAQAVEFSALSISSTDDDLLQRMLHINGDGSVHEVRVLPPWCECGKPQRRYRALLHVPPEPLEAAVLAGPPEIDAHQGAAHSPYVLFGGYGCHPPFHSRRCSCAGCVLSAALFSTRTSWNTRWHRARSRWAEDTASRRGCARAASHSPKAPEPDRTGHRDAATASVCSSATGGACVCDMSRLGRRSTRAVR